MSETVIKIDHVSKQYRLGTIGGGTLQGDIQSWWARVRHKEDPNLRIDQKAYSKNEKFLALDDISLQIQKGETLGLIGRNGAGKSTTLKLLSRVTAPTKGNIYIRGKISSMLEVGTGFHPELTGRENIYLNGAILGMKRSEVTKKIDDIIEFSECAQFIDTPVKRYSSGMFVKLAFSVAAHLDSDILIMDEVLAVGDMAFQKKCIDKMLSIAKDSGKTIIYVSHNMNTVRQLCSRCAVMEKGKIIFDGDTSEAIDLYLSSSKDELNLYNDFSSLKRPTFLTDKVCLLDLQVLNRDNLLIHDGESLDFRLRFEAKEDINGVCIRMIIYTMDQNPIATAVATNFADCKKGEIYTNDFSMDLSQLSSGRYKVLLAAYETDDIGSVFDADAAWPALIFDKEKTSDLDWKSRSYGNFELPQLKILK